MRIDTIITGGRKKKTTKNFHFLLNTGKNHSVTKRCLNPELIGKETGKYSNVYRGRERLSSRSGTRVPNPGAT